MQGVTLHINEDIFVDDLLHEYEARRQLRRWTKGKTAFINNGSVYTIKQVGSDVSERIRLQHPYAIILNDLDEAEAVKTLLSLAD